MHTIPVYLLSSWCAVAYAHVSNVKEAMVLWKDSTGSIDTLPVLMSRLVRYVHHWRVCNGLVCICCKFRIIVGKSILEHFLIELQKLFFVFSIEIHGKACNSLSLSFCFSTKSSLTIESTLQFRILVGGAK